MAATTASTVAITATVPSRNNTTINRLLGRPRCCCWKNEAGAAKDAASLETHLRRLALLGRFGRFEQLRRAEAERAGEYRRRQRFAPRVVFHHRVVIGLPRKGHLILGARELFLESEHVLVRLEIGMLLEHRHHPSERAAEHAFGAAERLHRRRIAGACRRGLRCTD